MTRPTARAAKTFAALGRSPGALFAVCLAANAVLSPYAGIFHDAMLYSGQAVNRADGGFLADDLFFKYGSQDKFSAFSLAVTPLVRAVGVAWAFFLGYLAAKALFLFATVRLVRALVPEPAVAAAGCLLLAVSRVPYSGNQLFWANEEFLTARLPAVAFALVGLERVLAGRRWAAGAAAVAACLFHPLMGAAALAVLAGWVAVTYPAARVALSLAAVGGAAALGGTDLGDRVFGAFDAEWKGYVRMISPFDFPDDWDVQDWVRMAVAAAVVGLAAAAGPDRRARRGLSR